MVTFKSPAGRRDRDDAENDGGDGNDVFDEQNYIQALGTDNAEGEWGNCDVQPGPRSFSASFQTENIKPCILDK